MRRVILGIFLSVMLAAGLGWATAARADSSTSAQSQGQQVLFLIPTDQVADFQQALSSGLKSDITWGAPSNAISIHGTQYSEIWVPADRVNEVFQETNGKPFQAHMLVAMALPQMENQGAASVTTAPGKEPTGYQASSAGSGSPGVVYMWQGKDVFLIPADQAASFDRSSAGGRQIMVVVPYDQYHAAIQPGTAASSSIPPFDQNHVLLLVPKDQLQNFSQLSSSDKQAFVVMPLDQFNQMTAGTSNATSNATSSTIQPSQEPTTTIQPSQEPTSYVAPAPELHALPLAGEATAIKEVFPTGSGNVVVLRDGEHFLVPDSVDPRGDLRAGNRFRGQYERRGGENLVTWMEIYQYANGDEQ